ncbi:uridine kinase [Curtobacterium sp. MCBA15_001]|uniref:uridine kinase family protein n=1 Tax=Curtobacterium sp. MCBA15_001 TaxID=1898731 RepID=UPI0008DE4FE8|nr:phosphoglycerate transporter [Curtobacterium sp. MCBA15_001]OIH93409.1 phosphoglycerate transporter [Curtobacterium sp. MCBA15_001]
MTDSDALVARIESLTAATGRPVVVGISGFCGSGKSTLARQLVDAVPDSVRMRGDDFLDPVRSHHRSTDWDGVERIRLRDTVLRPFRDGNPGLFRRFDWSTRALGDPEPVPTAQVLVVDLIGLFHPEVLDDLDLTVWCDVDLETAAARGMSRDAALGRRHDRLWLDVWVPNDRDFAQRWAPRARADVVF